VAIPRLAGAHWAHREGWLRPAEGIIALRIGLEAFVDHYKDERVGSNRRRRLTTGTRRGRCRLVAGVGELSHEGARSVAQIIKGVGRAVVVNPPEHALRVGLAT